MYAFFHVRHSRSNYSSTFSTYLLTLRSIINLIGLRIGNVMHISDIFWEFRNGLSIFLSCFWATYFGSYSWTASLLFSFFSMTFWYEIFPENKLKSLGLLEISSLSLMEHHQCFPFFEQKSFTLNQQYGHGIFSSRVFLITSKVIIFGIKFVKR